MFIISRARGNRLTLNQFVDRHDTDVNMLYVHLRARGFTRFDSFVAAFGEDYAARQSEIELVCAALESAPEWEETFTAIFNNSPTEEIAAHWDTHTALAKAKTSIAVKSLAGRMAALEESEAKISAAQAEEFGKSAAELERRTAEREAQRQHAWGGYDDQDHLTKKPVHSVNGIKVGKADESDPVQGTVEFFKAWRGIGKPKAETDAQ